MDPTPHVNTVLFRNKKTGEISRNRGGADVNVIPGVAIGTAEARGRTQIRDLHDESILAPETHIEHAETELKPDFVVAPITKTKVGPDILGSWLAREQP